MQIPLFPLSSVVLPEGCLPLRLFEPRYINMVSNCLKTDTGFGVCLIREGGEAGTPAQPFPLGTLAKITDFDQGSDGLLHITATGDQEFRLIDINVQKDGLLLGEIELEARPEVLAISNNPEDAVRELSTKLSLILTHLEPHITYPVHKLDDAEWVCNRLLELLPIGAEARFDILKSFDLTERLQALEALDFSVAEA